MKLKLEFEAVLAEMETDGQAVKLTLVTDAIGSYISGLLQHALKRKIRVTFDIGRDETSTG